MTERGMRRNRSPLSERPRWLLFTHDTRDCSENATELVRDVSHACVWATVCGGFRPGGFPRRAQQREAGHHRGARC